MLLINFLVVVILLLFNINNGQCQSEQLIKDIDNILAIRIDFTNSEEKRVPNLIKELKIAMDIANYLCEVVKITVPPNRRPQIENIELVLMTPTHNYSYPVTEAELILNNPVFNPNWMTVLLVTGYSTSFTGYNPALYAMYHAYMCRGNVNFIVVNSANYLDAFYPWSAFNTKNIGTFVALGLTKFFTNHPVDNFHLIGHSLGAHLAGMIGRKFIEFSGKILPRITGLDPAKPCFINDAKLKGLHSGDAVFVDVIHTDSAIVGLRQTVGDADFYPNGYHPIPPGCETLSCAHSRSWEYFAESVYPGNENGFMGAFCTSLKALNNGKCEGERYPMGISCPTHLRGQLFLNTNENITYGMFSKNLSEIQCSSFNPNKVGIIY